VSRKKRPEHSNHERWLVSYADFITLLFAFFVVLYSSSQVDQRKAGKLAKAIQTAFAQMGAFDSTSTRPQVLKPEDPSLSNFRAIQEGHAFETLKGGQPASVPDMKQIQKDLQASLAREISARTVSVTATREGIVVSLRELGFFDSGSPALQPDAISTLGNFVKVAGPGALDGTRHGNHQALHHEIFDGAPPALRFRIRRVLSGRLERYAPGASHEPASGSRDTCVECGFKRSLALQCAFGGCPLAERKALLHSLCGRRFSVPVARHGLRLRRTLRNRFSPGVCLEPAAESRSSLG
jgi:chemotaxis protein MotB